MQEISNNNNGNILSKLKLVFDGWHCLSKRQTMEILKNARNTLTNANFIDNVGLLIEHNDELEVHKFCLEMIEQYKGSFGSWNGYELKKISKKILYNYADRKRKLKFDYFKKLISENDFKDIKLVLAGILYLEPDDIVNIFMTIEKDLEQPLEVTYSELQDIYRLLIMYSASKERKFSLHK